MACAQGYRPAWAPSPASFIVCAHAFMIRISVRLRLLVSWLHAHTAPPQRPTPHEAPCTVSTIHDLEPRCALHVISKCREALLRPERLQTLFSWCVTVHVRWGVAEPRTKPRSGILGSGGGLATRSLLALWLRRQRIHRDGEARDRRGACTPQQGVRHARSARRGVFERASAFAEGAPNKPYAPCSIVLLLKPFAVKSQYCRAHSASA